MICNPEFVETHWGMERMWQHSCGTVLPAMHVCTGNKCLGMDPCFAQAPAATVAKRVAEAEAGLCDLESTTSEDSFGHENVVATLLWHCDACHACLYRRQMRRNGSMFCLRQDLSPAAPVAKRVAESKVRL